MTNQVPDITGFSAISYLPGYLMGPKLDVL